MSGHPKSPNFNDRDGVAIDMLVIHYTGMRSGDEALERLCDHKAEVSAHYVISQEGEVLSLVDEIKRAWHAGIASWRGHSNINSRSIGIELVNPGHEFGYQDFPHAQMVPLIDLCQGILARHDIAPRNVVGHSDVAPARKQDPGERFDWRRMAEAGIGLWPNLDGSVAAVPEKEAARALHQIGYDISDQNAAIAAFQRHYRPRLIDGVVDDETRQCIAAVLNLI
jgi:N-acetylmuramoyl-L-alanine amidase